MLHVDQLVRFERRAHRVVMVNPCRAIIVPIKRAASVPAHPHPHNPWPDGVSISPNSELEILPVTASPETPNQKPQVIQGELFPA